MWNIKQKKQHELTKQTRYRDTENSEIQRTEWWLLERKKGGEGIWGKEVHRHGNRRNLDFGC